MPQKPQPEPAPSIQALRLSDARWRAVRDTIRDAVVSIDSNGCIALFNPTAEKVFGYAEAEVLGQTVKMLMPSPYADEHDDYIRDYERTGIAKAIGKVRDVRAKRKNGEIFPIELSVSEARLDDEVIYTAIIRDVTERVRTDESLRARVRQQGAVAQLGRLALSRGDLGELLNEAVTLVAHTLEVDLCKILELLPDHEQLLLKAGTGWRAGLVGEAILRDATGSQAGYTLLSKGPVIVGDQSAETRFEPAALLADHGVVSGASVIIEGGNRPYGILGAHTTRRRAFSSDDVNFLQAVANILAEAIARHRIEAELHEAQEAARRRERLADIGAITAKVVHDLGNPLAALSMQAQLILRRSRRGDIAPSELAQQPAEQILSTIRRLESLIGDFRNFAGEQRVDPKRIDLANFLQSIVDLWQPLAADRSIELCLELGQVPPEFRGDEEKLRRVLDNLIKNAFDAIERGPGRVSIRTSVLSDGKIRISVEDTGPGIAEGVEVFRLFETTKPDGTGLGLAVAKQIVVAHGGTLEYAARTSGGAAFYIDLPPGGPARRGGHGSAGR